jgi:hypothetical protein
MFDIKLNLPVKLSLYVGLPSLAVILYYFQRSKKDYEGNLDTYKYSMKLCPLVDNYSTKFHLKLKTQSLSFLILFLFLFYR